MGDDKDFCIQIYKILDEIDEEMAEIQGKMEKMAIDRELAIKKHGKEKIKGLIEMTEEHMWFHAGEKAGLFTAKAIIAELFPECFK